MLAFYAESQSIKAMEGVGLEVYECQWQGFIYVTL